MTDTEELFFATRTLVNLWKPRLGIAEKVNVEVIEDDQLTEREKEAECVPIERDGLGLWEFTLQIVRTIDPDRHEPVVVHELVHVLIEPLRERWFDYSRDSEGADLVIWETVVDRIADAYLRAYAGPALGRRASPIGGRVFLPD